MRECKSLQAKIIKMRVKHEFVKKLWETEEASQFSSSDPAVAMIAAMMIGDQLSFDLYS